MSVLGESTPQRSSSLELSSPPNTPPQRDFILSHTSHPTHPPNKNTVNRATKDSDAAPNRRKKKDVENKDVTSDATNGDVKIKKPRVPRGQGPRAMKKKKMEEEARKAAELAAATATATAASSGTQNRTPPISTSSLSQAEPPKLPSANHPFLSMHVNTSQKGNHEAIHNSPPHQTQTLQHFNSESRPSSGQNYDPIRSSTIARHLSPPTNIMSTPPKPAAVLDATRSPSISSLIDPPIQQLTSFQQTSKRSNDDMSFYSNEIKRPRLTPPDMSSIELSVKSDGQGRTGSNVSSFNRHDETGVGLMSLPIISSTKQPSQLSAPASKKPTPGMSKGPSPTSNSPKPVMRKEAPALPAAGSGLLTGSIFGAAGNVDESASTKLAPTVIIDVPLIGKDHHTINFTRLAEEKYGFDALHPRLAAQRERLARVAAAGAALERAQKSAVGASIDDMSEDLSNDDGDNSNVEMNGVSGTKSGEDVDKPARKKRIMKEDMYDVDDEFIDDTEQAWEEQAAVSKDGFFVYSGPLVPEGQEAKVERSADNAPKRSTRGGRGGRGGGTARPGRSTTSKDSKDEKEVKKRVRRSKEQIERDRKEAEEKKTQKERQTLLVSKPPAPFLPSQPAQMQFQAHPIAN